MCCQHTSEQTDDGFACYFANIEEMPDVLDGQKMALYYHTSSRFAGIYGQKAKT